MPNSEQVNNIESIYLVCTRLRMLFESRRVDGSESDPLIRNINPCCSGTKDPLSDALKNVCTRRGEFFSIQYDIKRNGSRHQPENSEVNG